MLCILSKHSGLMDPIVAAIVDTPGAPRKRRQEVVPEPVCNLSLLLSLDFLD